MLGSEELFFPILRRWTGTFKRICCNCHLMNRDEILEGVDNVKKLPRVIKVLCSAIIRFVSKLLHYFLLWGTEDSDLTIEEEVQSVSFMTTYIMQYMWLLYYWQHIGELEDSIVPTCP